MFGSSFGNPSQSQSPFGAQQSKPNTGFFSQTNTQSPFGQSASSPFGQPQNTSPFGQNTGGQGLFTGQQQTQPTGGLFGQSNPSQGGGLFGQANTQTSAPGLFGAQQQQPSNTGGLFGSQQPPTSNVFGGPQQGVQGGLFGQPNQPTQQGGLFGAQGGQTGNPQGQGLFGASTTQGGGLFGQSNLNTGSSPFGTAARGAQGSSFQGTSNLFGGSNQPQGGGLFGATQPATTSPFGAPTQTSNLFGGGNQQQPSTGGNALFGTFANPTQSTPSSVFGAPSTTSNVFGAPNQTQPFGQTQTAFNPNATMSNKLGGTTWGVPTNPQGATQAVLVQPVRSKNTKLDAKHLVKCIAALDQFQGLSKEQLRVNFIQAGGQQPTLSQQSSGGFKPLGQTATSAIPSLPSFGGSQNLSAPGGNLFGGQQNTQASLFAKPAGNAPTVGAFGAPQQTSSLFGALTQPQATSSLFSTGQTAFQSNVQQPQQGSLFATAASSSLLPPTGSLFNAPPLQAPPSLFNPAGQTQPQPQTGSLFGSTPTPSLFGQPAAQPPNFAQALGTAVTASTAGLAPNPYNTSPGFGQATSLFNQLAPPLAPPMYPPLPGQTDQSTQALVPLLLTYLLTQNQQQQSSSETGSGNPTLDALNKIVMALNNQNKPNQPQSSLTSGLLTPTPFDQYLRQQAQKWPSKPTERYSLFSDAEAKQFEEIDSKSFARQKHFYDDTENDETDKIYQTYRPAKKVDPFGEPNLRIINKQYKGAQQQLKRYNTPTIDQLPDIGNFSINPPLDKLKNMTIPQIKRVDRVKVYNNFGAIQFLQPISLYKLNIPRAIKIAQDNIQIVDPELQQKKLRITFNNFGKFSTLTTQNQKKLVKKMRQWLESRGMKEISFDSQTGNLIVETQD